jgi:site-specific recombinase XerD
MVVRRNNRGWGVDFWLEHPDGKRERVRKRSPIQTKRGAEEYESRLRQELINGTHQEVKQQSATPTVASFEKEFLLYAKANNKPSEQANKRSMLSKYLLPYFGHKRMDKISRGDIEAFKVYMLSFDLSNSTVNKTLVTLGKMLNYAQELELISAVPRIKKLKPAPQIVEFLDDQQLECLLSAWEKTDHALYLAVLLGAHAGLRRGEIAGLKWRNVSFPFHNLAVVQTMWSGQEQTPKNKKLRIIPLTARLEQALKKHHHMRSEFVLVQSDNTPWSDKIFAKYSGRLYALAGLPRPRQPWHVLRHSFASRLVMRGATIKAVQELLGHADVQMTMRYAHLSPAARVSAIQLLDQPSTFGHYLVTSGIEERQASLTS